MTYFHIAILSASLFIQLFDPVLSALEVGDWAAT